MGGVTGGVRLPLLCRGGVDMLLRDTLPANDRDSLGWIFFFWASCSRLAASVMNLERGADRQTDSRTRVIDGWIDRDRQRQVDR